MSLTAEHVRDVLSYDPVTGEFRRRSSGKVIGSRTANGYVALRVGGTMRYAHRVAWLYVTGAWPQNEIDHIDGDCTNNAITNLRDVDRSINSQNARKARSTNRSAGLLGVHRRKDTGRYSARIEARGDIRHLGCFDTAAEAHAAYVAAKRNFHEGNTL